jgi:hypothetical protein
MADPQAACAGKFAYPSPQHAQRQLDKLKVKPQHGWHNYRKPDPVQKYRCPHCGAWHIGGCS